MAKVYKYKNSANIDKYVLYDEASNKIEKLNNPNNGQKTIANQNPFLGSITNDKNTANIKAIIKSVPVVEPALTAETEPIAESKPVVINTANQAAANQAAVNKAAANQAAANQAAVNKAAANQAAVNKAAVNKAAANKAAVNQAAATQALAPIQGSPLINSNSSANTTGCKGTPASVKAKGMEYEVCVGEGKPEQKGGRRTRHKKQRTSRKQKRSTRNTRKQNKCKQNKRQ